MTSALHVMLKPVGEGRLTPLLCDEHGEPLPGQMSVKIETSSDDITMVTVKFCAITFSLPPGVKV